MIELDAKGVEPGTFVSQIFALKGKKHGLSDTFPSAVRIAYDIGYLDALLAVADLFMNWYTRKTIEESAK